MSFSIRTAVFDLNTSVGTQDLTISGIGTPDAVVIIATRAYTDDMVQTGSSICIGMTDGTTIGHTMTYGSDGSTHRGRVSSEVSEILIGLREYYDSTIQLSIAAVFDSLITDGVRINIVTLNESAPQAWKATVLFIFADNVKVLTQDLGSTTSEQTQSGLSFQGNLIISATVCDSMGDTDTTYDNISLGFAYDDGESISQASTSIAPYIYGRTMCSDGCIAAQAGYSSTDAIDWQLVINSFTSTGYTFQTDASTSGDDCLFLVVDTGDTECAVGVASIATGTGDTDVTGLGITPDVVIGVYGQAATNVDGYAKNGGYGFCVGIYSQTDSYSRVHENRQISTTSSTRVCYTDDDFLVTHEGSSHTLELRGDITAVDSGEFTVSVTTNTRSDAMPFAYLVTGGSINKQHNLTIGSYNNQPVFLPMVK